MTASSANLLGRVPFLVTGALRALRLLFGWSW